MRNAGAGTGPAPSEERTMYYLPDDITPIVMPPDRITPARRFAIVRWTPAGASLPLQFSPISVVVR